MFYPLTSVSLFVSEVYVGWIEITDSLMGSLIVPVFDEFIMSVEHPGFTGVGFMEGFDLADSGRSSNACNNMLDSISSAELGEG